jgi:hypothetical protein
MPLQHFQLLAILEADEVVGRDRLLRFRRFWLTIQIRGASMRVRMASGNCAADLELALTLGGDDLSCQTPEVVVSVSVVACASKLTCPMDWTPVILVLGRVRREPDLAGAGCWRAIQAVQPVIVVVCRRNRGRENG